MASPSASGSCSGQEDKSGSKRDETEAPYSVSRSRPRTGPETAPEERWVLIIEDNPGDIVLLRHALQQWDVHSGILVMNDGEKAEQFLDEIDADGTKCPALIVLDLNLPRKPGIEVLEKLRVSRVLRDVPIVVFSSSEAPSDRSEALRLGANQYIVKPSTLDEFLKIGGVLKRFLADDTWGAG